MTRKPRIGQDGFANVTGCRHNGTDKLGSYAVAHQEGMPSVEHINTVYANNRVEVSHQPTRQQEYHMRGFCFIATGSTIFDLAWAQDMMTPNALKKTRYLEDERPIICSKDPIFYLQI